MKYADSKGIPYAVILGSDEVEAGTVAVRDLSSREQQVIRRENLVDHIHQLANT